jgi:hypothetical protein
MEIYYVERHFKASTELQKNVVLTTLCLLKVNNMKVKYFHLISTISTM